jgi:hypothetical protein
MIQTPFPTPYVRVPGVSLGVPFMTAEGAKATAEDGRTVEPPTTNVPPRSSTCSSSALGVWHQPFGVAPVGAGLRQPPPSRIVPEVKVVLPERRRLPIFTPLVIHDPNVSSKPLAAARRRPRIHGVVLPPEDRDAARVLIGPEPWSRGPRYLQYIQGPLDPLKAYSRENSEVPP